MTEKKNHLHALDLKIGPSIPTLSIFLISVLGLFLEMMLIRWIGTEIRIFAYLQNSILVVCFLGLGLGCFTSNKRIDIRGTIFPLLFMTALLAIPISRNALGNIGIMLTAVRDVSFFGQAIATSTTEIILFISLGLTLTFFLMLLILDMFVPIGRILGRLMDNHPSTICAYSVNIAGSLIGTWLFVIASSLSTPPIVWCAIVVLLSLFFQNKSGRERIINMSLCIVLIISSWFAGIENGSLEVKWSPYQKLVLRETDHTKGEIGKYLVNVNNVRYQEMVDLSPHIRNTDSEEQKTTINGYSQYDIQLLLHPNPKKMLIVGSGTGNDVAGGLRHGVQEITAVDIDPVIISMGRRFHPQKPYDSPRVRVINDDARSFFASCEDRFDVISFGLLDSHTSSVMTNTRLDEYVYTRESIDRAKSLLADGGILFLHFGAQEHFIADRLASILRYVFNQEPMSFAIPKSDFGIGGIMFVAGNLNQAKEQITKDPALEALIKKWQQESPFEITYTTTISTDNWPYLYLKAPRIPLLYYLLTGIMLLLFLRSCRHWEVSAILSRWDRVHWHFFFLGAAFMLLEVQNVSKAAVALGSTWEVNAIIISGVLVMILLANLIVSKFPKLPSIPAYIILCLTCLLLYYVDLASFAFLPYFPKAILIGGLTTLPMFFSGIIFIRSFANVGKKDQALGSNLFGALIGALLQSITFIIGIKALLLIVIVLYVLSFLAMPRNLTQQSVNFNA